MQTSWEKDKKKRIGELIIPGYREILNVNVQKNNDGSTYIGIGEHGDVGYLYMRMITESEKISSFIGMYVQPGYRRSGISDALLDSYISLSESLKVDRIITAKTQRKPLMLHFLASNYFIPNNIDENKAIYILNQKTNNNKVGIHIPELELRKRFMQTRIYKESYWHYDMESEYKGKIYYKTRYELQKVGNQFQRKEKDKYTLSLNI